MKLVALPKKTELFEMKIKFDFECRELRYSDFSAIAIQW